MQYKKGGGLYPPFFVRFGKINKSGFLFSKPLDKNGLLWYTMLKAETC